MKTMSPKFDNDLPITFEIEVESSVPDSNA
jgi:hypothetical protein